MNGTTTGWLRYQFPQAQYVTSYRMTARSDCSYCNPRAFTLEGSNDGATWAVVDTRTNEAGWVASQVRAYTIASPGLYLYYRVNVTQNDGHASVVCLTELDLLSAPDLHFDLNAFRMRTRSGASWTNVQRVVVGEATTNASAVTSATAYALRGHYRADVGNVAVNSLATVTHNLGVPPLDMDVALWAEDLNTGYVQQLVNNAIVDYNYEQSFFSMAGSSNERKTFGMRFTGYVLVYKGLDGVNRPVSTNVRVFGDFRRRW